VGVTAVVLLAVGIEALHFAIGVVRQTDIDGRGRTRRTARVAVSPAVAGVHSFAMSLVHADADDDNGGDDDAHGTEGLSEAACHWLPVLVDYFFAGRERRLMARRRRGTALDFDLVRVRDL